MTDAAITTEAAIELLAVKLKAKLSRLHISMDEPDLPDSRADALAREISVVTGHIHLLDEIGESIP